MTATENVIRWSTAGAVLGVATVAAVASYEHAYDLRRVWLDRPYGPAGGGRPDLREFDGDARFSTPQDAGASAGEVAPRSGHRGDARG